MSNREEKERTTAADGESPKPADEEKEKPATIVEEQKDEIEIEIDAGDDQERLVLDDDEEMVEMGHIGRSLSRMPRALTSRARGYSRHKDEEQEKKKKEKDEEDLQLQQKKEDEKEDKKEGEGKESGVHVTIDEPKGHIHHHKHHRTRRHAKSVLDFLDPHVGRTSAAQRERHLAEVLESKLLWTDVDEESTDDAGKEKLKRKGGSKASSKGYIGFKYRGEGIHHLIHRTELFPHVHDESEDKAEHVNVDADADAKAEDVEVESTDSDTDIDEVDLVLTYTDTLRSIFDSHSVLFNIEALDLKDVIRAGIEAIAHQHNLSDMQKEIAIQSAFLREEAFSGMSGGAYDVVLAHVPYLPVKENGDEMLSAFCHLENAVNMDAADGIPTKFVIVLLGKPDQATHHANLGIALNCLMTDEEFHNDAYMAKERKDLVKAYDSFTERIYKSEEEEVSSEISVDPDHLHKKTRKMRLGEGIYDDFRRRFPYFLSDFKDGIAPKSISSILFLFFAALTPAIAFGGLMGPLTGMNIGALETVAATALCGVGFGLFAGQPLIILGATGPMLVFTALLYKLTVSAKIAFLPLYAWTGIWTGIFAIILSVTNASVWIEKFTRFTDEIFATLISVIFIYEAVEKSVHPYIEAQHGDVTAHLAADRSLLLALGTFAIAIGLKSMRKGRYLSTWAREFLADFGLIISVLIMTALDLILHDVRVEHMNVPSDFSPTNKRASWFVNPGELSVGYVFVSMALALLSAILLFLDQNITARLVNKADNNLKKAPGTYHLDTLVVGILIIVCSLLGFPWMVASTVPSINHINSLAVKEDFQSPSDPTHRVEHIIFVLEQRVTPIMIHILVGLSLLLVDLMNYIPSHVLYGLFLYMGVSSLNDNQFFDRIKLLFMQPSLFPKSHYVRRVNKWKIHLFTLIQILSLVILWVIKTSPEPILALMFPVALLLLLVIRWVIGLKALRMFKSHELAVLDAEEGPDFNT